MSLTGVLYHVAPTQPSSTRLVFALPSLSTVIYHAHTLWLFTESDLMTTMIPIPLFAIVAAPLTSLHNLPHAVFWLWFHLLHFNTSNQTATLEDETNKPDRPLPAGRISLKVALILRWTLLPMCWALSRAYSKEVMYASLWLTAFTSMYNELGGSGKHFAVRYLLNGLGFAAFEAGTTLVARDDRTLLDATGWLSIFLSGSIFATTIYAQDFRDVVGDALINRDTIPLRWGSPSRYMLFVGVVAWSLALSIIWHLDMWSAVSFTALGIYAGSRFIRYTTVEEDRNSYFYYNVWVSVAHLLPGYWRVLCGQ
ncbi:UbiA prenyltransferase family-domain-containing protein [Roridomyces roridus]|uniref:UbiA prenyltransferase family-domain-containing protein n=1 Tax=Roridomyces roridus TaxID=1738132 RepID=A0AAD7BBX9_9AGAR|nr:UbiA prenyltransferase family-domain-containing protein [Roridomyces roridus]